MPVAQKELSPIDFLHGTTLCPFFQPIVSLKTGRIFAYEALIRGLDDKTGEIIGPDKLFARAARAKRTVEFDCECREAAITTFAPFRERSSAMLFMNIETSTINAERYSRMVPESLARRTNLSPQRLGLELIESKEDSSGALIEFVNHYRQEGFLIVIDDFGSKHSNLDRLIQIHPDIIKIDRSIISGIDTDTYRQSILKSVHSLAEMTGALCLAEGVETIGEIKTCHNLGADLFQGYAIARPAANLQELEAATKERTTSIQAEIRQSTLEALRKRKKLTGDINVLADWLVRQLSPETINDITSILEEFIAMNDEVECIYMLDANGIQISDTVMSPLIEQRERHSIFRPAKRGADHSFKTYYSCFEALGIRRFLTDVYLSLASGNLCRTFSTKIVSEVSPDYILCIDFLEDRINTEQ